MSRIAWKGELGFGLPHAPVSLCPASRQDEIDFDWLRNGTLQPVGYKRVVKDIGEEVDKGEVVKAVQYRDKYAAMKRKIGIAEK